MAVTVLLFLYALFLSRVHEGCRHWLVHPVKKWLVRTIFAVMVVIAALVVIESACMIRAAVKTPAENSTVVVLGCRVYGERASLSLKERLDAARAYLTEHENAKCILSGGQGPGESITEAECMYRYLVSHGIEAGRLYKEERSTSTRENLLYSGMLIEEHGLNPAIAIVTSEYHEYRAGKIAGEMGLKYGAVPGRSAWWMFPTHYVRELYAILYEWIF